MAKLKRTKLKVSRAALMARINRKLAHKGERLAACRSQRWERDLGQFFIRDFERNHIVDGHINPVELARELGVLADYEDAEGF